MRPTKESRATKKHITSTLLIGGVKHIENREPHAFCSTYRKSRQRLEKRRSSGTGSPAFKLKNFLTGGFFVDLLHNSFPSVRYFPCVLRRIWHHNRHQIVFIISSLAEVRATQQSQQHLSTSLILHANLFLSLSPIRPSSSFLFLPLYLLPVSIFPSFSLYSFLLFFSLPPRSFPLSLSLYNFLILSIISASLPRSASFLHFPRHISPCISRYLSSSLCLSQ